MSDYEGYEDSEDEQQIQQFRNIERDAVESFDLGLFEEGDAESGFHTLNDPQDPFQRSNVTQRKGAVDVKCSLIDVVHGEWGGEDQKAKATLLVLLFRFDPKRRARRITYAKLEFRFYDMQDRQHLNPEVFDISLNESLSIVPTKRNESVTRAVDGSVGGGILGAEMSTTVSWEKRIDQETTDATRIIGSTDRLKAMRGPENSASWTLLENSTTQTGIPAMLQVGILLKRQTDDDFACAVKINTEADFRTRVEQLFGGRGEGDDPILFHTSLEPTNKLMKYDAANLGSFDLSRVEDVVFTNVRAGVIKESHNPNRPNEFGS